MEPLESFNQILFSSVNDNLRMNFVQLLALRLERLGKTLGVAGQNTRVHIAGFGGLGNLLALFLSTAGVRYDLPLQLTDAISAVAVLALWTRRQGLVELLYFWSLTATLQAILTPDLGWDFPSVYYFTYFTYHIGAVVGACLLVFGCGLYPRPGAAMRVFWLTLAWAAVAGLADLVTGGNYMYLRAKPEHGSLLSVVGPWPWYIFATVALALALLLGLEWLTSRLRRRDLARRGTTEALAV